MAVKQLKSAAIPRIGDRVKLASMVAFEMYGILIRVKKSRAWVKWTTGDIQEHHLSSLRKMGPSIEIKE